MQYIYLVLLQRAGSTNLAYETKIVDIRGTKELLLDSLRASSPGALAAGGKKERELATASLAFEYLHRKSRCEMLIGGDDISNDVITPGTCFSMFVYIRADRRKSDSSVDGEAQGNWRWNSISRDVAASFPPFPAPPPEQ